MGILVNKKTARFVMPTPILLIDAYQLFPLLKNGIRFIKGLRKNLKSSALGF